MANFPTLDAPQKRGALAIFCRAPRLGTVKTRIAQTRGDDFALGLYRAMLQDTFDLARKLAPDVQTFACFTPEDGFEGENSLAELWDGPKLAQCEGDLGAKMLDCLGQLRERGFEKIAIIGSDSPDLPQLQLRRALETLDGFSGLVFGPAPDGGFYLLGASVAVPPWLLENVTWSSSKTLRQIRRKIATRRAEKLEWAQLPSWRDVDDEADLIELRRRLFELGTHAPRTRDFLENHRE